MTSTKKRILLLSTVAAMIVAAPIASDRLGFGSSEAWAQSSGNQGGGNQGSGNQGGGNQGGGNQGGGNQGGGNQGGSNGGHNDGGHDDGSHDDGGHDGGGHDDGGHDGIGVIVVSPGNSGNYGSDRDTGSSDRGNGGSDRGNTGNSNSGRTIIPVGTTTSNGASGAGNSAGNGQMGAGQPATTSGGRPTNPGTGRGDLYGDLYVILRDENGVPILTAEGFVQPLDAEGNPIPLDDEGLPLDESLTQEVELGRLNVGRAPLSVLARRTDEVVALLNSATEINVDAAGRLVLTVDGVAKTIDSPLENLAIYVALMTTGTIAGVTDLPGTEYDFMVDGVFTQEDLAASVAFLAAATDKTGEFTADEIAYVNAFVDINTQVVGDVTYSVVDYSGFTYDREATFGDVEVEVLVQQPDGSWKPTVVNVLDAVFGGELYTGAGTIDAYTQAADDARAIVNFIHEYDVPAGSL